MNMNKSIMSISLLCLAFVGQASISITNSIVDINNNGGGYYLQLDGTQSKLGYGEQQTVSDNYYAGFGVVTNSTAKPYYTHIGISVGTASCTANIGTCTLKKLADNSYAVSLTNPLPPVIDGPTPPSGDLVKLVNNSPYYLFSKDSNVFFTDSTGDAPAEDNRVEPSATVYVKKGYFGVITCSGSNYSTEQGSCMEQANAKPAGTLTEGGYATYLGLNTSLSTGCSIAPGVHWSCRWDQTSGDFTLTYMPVIDTDASAAFSSYLHNNISSYTELPFRGINISGLEYDGTYLDALFQEPGLPEMVYFTNEGMNTVRLPIRAEFWLSDPNLPTQSTYENFANAQPNDTYIQSVHNVVKQYLSQGLVVILDLHNYMRFCDTGPSFGQTNEPTNDGSQANAPTCHIMTKADLTSVWQHIMTDKSSVADDESFAELAQQYPNQLMFGLMNEPYSSSRAPNQIIATEDVFANELSAATTIRALAPDNYIIFSGNYWDPMHGWVHGTTDSINMGLAGNGDTYDKNKQAIAALGNTIVEVHQYVDSNFSGLSDTCNTYASYDAFKNDNQLELSTFTEWMNTSSAKVFLSEFGATSNPTCEADLHYLMKYVSENSTDLHSTKGGFVGWMIWRANRNLAPGVAFGSNNAIQSPLDGTFYSGLTPIKKGAANPLMAALYCKKEINGDYGYLMPIGSPNSSLPTDCEGY